MQWEDVISLLDTGESQTVEFDRSIPSEDDIAREMVAFSNSDGGKIILGIDDKNKHLVGVKPREDMEEWVQKIARENCSPPLKVSVETLFRTEKNIVIIDVQPGDERPYRTDDICYIRDGAKSRTAADVEEKQITNPWAGKGLNRRQHRAMQLITEQGNLTNREYREAFNVSHKTAHLEMTMLVDKGLLMAEGAGRSTRYILSEPTTDRSDAPVSNS